MTLRDIRAMAVSGLMVTLLLWASALMFQQGNNFAGVLLLLVLGLMGTIGFLVSLLDSVATEVWSDGYEEGQRAAYRGLDYEGQGQD